MHLYIAVRTQSSHPVLFLFLFLMQVLIPKQLLIREFENYYNEIRNQFLRFRIVKVGSQWGRRHL